jgi:hypothetical protein
VVERDPDLSLRRVFDRAATVHVRNVLNPLLWLTAVVMPASFIAAWAAGFQTLLGALLVVLGAIPALASVIAYMIFAFRDPDRLQSEEYRLRQRAIHFLYRRGGTAEIADVATLGRPSRAIEHKVEGND